jgi:hypothetical protein
MSAATPLRFRITRAPMSDTQGAPWYVTGNRRDWADDYVWGHFSTWLEAMLAARFWILASQGRTPSARRSDFVPAHG